MKYGIRDREAGNIIESNIETYEEAERILAGYEEADKKDGIYEEDFYEIFEVEPTSTSTKTEKEKKSMKNYWVEHNSIEISKFDKDFKKYDGTRESLEEIIKSHLECSDNQDKYNTLEEALKKASEPYCREMEGNAYRYLLIEYDTIWEEDPEEDTFDSLGVYGIDIEK